MAFHHLAGVTTAGAPDEIVDWFATFQQWMTVNLGWTVAAGAGTTDVVFQSIGEGAGPPLTMLFIHVWRDLGNPNRVRIEVSDDIIPTHETVEGGYVDGAGAQFAYWMTGDMDAIVICFRGGALYNTVYAGMVIPFALTVPDETYRMIATSIMTQGSILRDAGGVWDVDHGIHDNDVMDGSIIDVYDGSFPFGGTFFDRQANIAGQLMHISGEIAAGGVTVNDVLTTGQPGATTTWIVLQDRTPTRYAMRTGGVLPVGQQDPVSFTAVSGVAANYAGLWAAITGHLTGLGWASLGDPGLWDEGRLYFSAGESGQDEIYIGFGMSLIPIPDSFYFYTQDDAGGTHRFPVGEWKFLDAADFPLNYWLCGDRDCLVMVIQRAPGYTLFWSGRVPAFAPGLNPPYPGGVALTPYQSCAFAWGDGPGAGALLRQHNGVWNDAGARMYNGGADQLNSNPNNFDGTTYLLWPIVATGQDFIGQMRYIGFSSGGGIANLDTLTIGPQVYTVFFDFAGSNFCVRTV